jgi:hypothetical protein
MRRVLLALPALLCLPVLADGARAQTIPSPFRYVEPAQSIHVHGGYLSTASGDFGLTPHSAPIFGVQYEGRFTGPLSGVVVVDVMPSKRTVQARTSTSDPSAPLTPVDESDDVVLSAEAGLRLSITGARTWHRLQPYIAATAGIVRDFSSRTEAERQLAETQLVSFGPGFAVGVAAGIDLFATDRFSIRLQGKDHLWRRSVPEGLSSTGRSTNEWTNNLGATVGAAIHF